MPKTKRETTDPKSALAQAAPDTARYGRENPEAEAGMGRLDNNIKATPCRSADKLEQTVRNRQELRQINAEDEKGK